MTSTLDLIKRKKKEMEAKKASSIRPIKPAPGKNMYRILPTWRKGAEENQFWHDFGMHWVRSEKGGKPIPYLCLDKTYEKECPVCNAIGAGIRGASDDETINLLKGANASQRFLINVLHLNDSEKKNEPQIMEIGVTVFDDLISLMEDYGDVTDLEKGIDIIIKREGKGLDTSYTVLPSPKGPRKVDPSVMEKVADLDAAVAQENEAILKKALNALSAAAGVLPTEAASRPALADYSVDDAEDAEFDDVTTSDAEETVDASVSTSDAAVDDDLGDLDDLLDELEAAG